jgi:hypothetical protein
VSRLSKSDIQRRLLSGSKIDFKDAAGKNASLQLADAKQRRLFDFLLGSDVREPTGLTDVFISGLRNVYEDANDPATSQPSEESSGFNSSGPWKLHAIKAEGFGGLNTWKGGAFEFEFASDSIIFEGPNGSGKSSLAAAIIWALANERPRDQCDIGPSDSKPIYGDSGKPIGDWPPIACYPPSIAEATGSPTVRVKLTFKDPVGQEGTVERVLSNGSVSTNISANFTVPPVLIETGFLMPSRLMNLRFSDGKGRLTDAIQQLTGLDDLVAIGALVTGLTHASREYRAYRSKELAALNAQFTNALDQARAALKPVNIDVPIFKTSDASNPQGALATLGKEVVALAAEHATVIASDLQSGLDLANLKIQSEVVANIATAKQDVQNGLGNLRTWELLNRIANEISTERESELLSAASAAEAELADAQNLLSASQKDTRFRLKALGAQWHDEHASGAIANCPLCKAALKDATLSSELEALRGRGEAATRSFADNLNAILATLDGVLPPNLKGLNDAALPSDPQQKLIEELRAAFVDKPIYASSLVKISKLVGDALTQTPNTPLAPDVQDGTDSEPEAAKLVARVALTRKLVSQAKWLRKHRKVWNGWWDNLAGKPEETELTTEKSVAHERLTAHLQRLADALEKTGPYRNAAAALRDAFAAGKSAHEIQTEVNRRDAIADSLSPLKGLNNLCEAMSRDAINGLSTRIEALLNDVLIAEQLRYSNTSLDRKEGVIVRAGFSHDLRVDATLVANTSWLRAVLWCFIFSLREEAVEYYGRDALPLFLFDDPQVTFDTYHRARWAHYIAGRQNGPGKVQVLLLTYEAAFIDLIRADGVAGRDICLAAPGPQSDCVSTLEGAAVDRKWQEAEAAKTPKLAQEYIMAVRVYVEGLLKLMARGKDDKVRGMVLGDLRNLIDQENKSQRAPWNMPAFANLVSLLLRSNPAITYLEGSHHSTGQSYGMIEAAAVNKHWSKLRQGVERAFRIIRDHRILHGDMDALFLLPSTIDYPDGYQSEVQKIPLSILGRAAALTNGRVADGEIDVDHFDSKKQVVVTLGKHSAYRLMAPTLEPAARPGDLLLTRDFGQVTSRSLVVARVDDRLLARRYERSENMADVAALTAQSINPRMIAPPVVLHNGSLDCKKIVGVLFGSGPPTGGQSSQQEVCDCGGAAALSVLSKNALGLVQVEGQSAEPLALDKQYLIIESEVASAVAMKGLDGKPVIAEDSRR